MKNPKFKTNRNKSRKSLDFKDKLNPSTTTEKTDSKDIADMSSTDSSTGKSNSNSNHPQWYTRNEILTRSLGHINFAGFKGVRNSLLLQRIPYRGRDFDESIGTKYEHIQNRFPGIMTHDYYQTFGGLTSTGNDGEELARIIYANLRRAISGRRTYDANTVFQYLVSVGSLQAAFGELHRALAATVNRSTVNRYFGERLVEALGFEYDDLANNYNEYASSLTLAAASAQLLVMPEGIELFKKWYWMASSIFLDQEDDKSGLIAFIPQGFWEFRPLHDDITSSVAKTLSQTLTEVSSSVEVNARYDSIYELGRLHTEQELKVAPFGLVYSKYTQQGVEDNSRFKSILSRLRAAAFRYTENSDFATIAGDMLKTYGDKVIYIPEFKPGTWSNITYDAGVVQATKNISYAPFEPKAIIEFPGVGLAHKARRRGMFYVVDLNNRFTLPYTEGIEGESHATLVTKFSELVNPIESYVFSQTQDVDPGQAMSMLKWHMRYRVTAKFSQGNVFVMNRSTYESESVRPAALYLETMGTEIITASHIYGIKDYLETQTDQGAIGHESAIVSPYGLMRLTWNFSNYQFIKVHTHSITEDNDMVRAVYSNREGILPADAIRYQAWMRHWDSAPVLYQLLVDILTTPRQHSEHETAHFRYKYATDLVTLNPFPHYNVISTDTLRRHHEVALASMLAIGSWDTNGVVSTGGGTPTAMSSDAFKS